MFICEKCLQEIRQPGWPKWFNILRQTTCDRCNNKGMVHEIHIDYILGLNKKVDAKPMEKTLKMSVETARKFYQECINNNWSGITDLLLENFTKEELEPKKGFTWEESFSGEGFCLRLDDSSIIKYGACTPNEHNKNIFKTEKQAKSALAFSQLSHIVAKMNEGKQPENRIDNSWNETRYYAYEIKRFYCTDQFTFIEHDISPSDKTSTVQAHLLFFDKKDAITSLEVNRVLWEQYWML